MRTTHRNGSEGTAPRLPVYILAGGKSTRYGSDKARATVDGTPLVVRLANLLSTFARSITVVAPDPGLYEEFGLRTIGDIIRDKGPMGGVFTALDDCGPDGWAFVTACDWIGIRAEWMELLWQSRRLGSQAVVFRSAHYEPLFGLYHTSLREALRERISTGALAMHELLAEVRTVEVSPPAGWEGASNVNRPDDLPR